MTEEITSCISDRSQELKEMQDDSFRYRAAAFLAGVSGISLLGGFGMTMSYAKKADPEMFTKGVTAGSTKGLESGGSLALRALGKGTLYAVSGFGIFCYGIWKMMDVKNMAEFREKVGGSLPKIPKNDPPQSRTEFEGIRDFLEYVIEEDKKKRNPTDTR